MANNNTSLEQLKSFLNQLFQFDSQDLDFGVYKILHYKKKEIATFIDQLLVDKVKAELQTLSADEAKQVQDQIAEMEKSTSLTKWLEAVEKKDETRLAIYEEDYKNEIAQYKELKAKATESSVSVETENQIYNHLTLFFSRYYDKGDFISKRRFGKNEKYVVPYNGEETHFHWANQDQYYIKSSETFNQYAFIVPTSSSEMVVNFKLTDAQVEQGNVKESDNNYFILSEKEAEINNEELTFFFEYRSMTDDEKKKIKGNSKQDTLDEIAYDLLKKKFGANPVLANLWKEQGGKPLLLKKLQHFTRKNKYDFFIHKNLKAFLQRELDYYIKSELVNVDDFYITDTDSHFDRLKHNLKTIKVFKSIADIIIEFVSQIEEFQKKLWEKKKFVLTTEWVITIDRLVEYVGELAAKPLLEEVIKNEKQVSEWKQLFGNINSFKSVNDLKSGSGVWRKLPIDTKFFHSDFKDNLLGRLSEYINLSELSEGFVLHSDNFQGLNLIYDSYTNRIDSIHIDPPYNTDSSGFLYKNGYKTSSWLTMMEDRLTIAKDLLSIRASLACHIDEFEYENLYHIIKKLNLPFLGTIVWDKKNPMMGGTGLAIQHEFIIWASYHLGQFSSKSENLKRILNLSKKIIAKHHGVNEEARIEFKKEIQNDKLLSGGERMYHLLEDDGRIFQSVGMSWPNPNPAPKEFFEPLLHPITKTPCPVPPRGWSRSPIKMKELLERDEIIFGETDKTQPRRKIYLDIAKKKQLSSIISNGIRGRTEMLSLGLNFSYSHPTSLYEEINFASMDKNGINLDFFAGSGTSFHSIQSLNKEDSGNRKSIVIEQGPYVHSLIIPRIKKVAYTFDWKDGTPKDESMNGLGVFFKYQRLEQYEEALENIAFNTSQEALQKALEFDEYIPKYFLELETKGSQTLVNISTMQDPWNYKLKVWDGFTYNTEQAVDLVETFNYLIGLHMQKSITKVLNGKKYQFIYGNNNTNKNILVVWRSVKDWKLDDFKKDSIAIKEELKCFNYDLLYINDQAHLEGYLPIEEVFKNKMLS